MPLRGSRLLVIAAMSAAVLAVGCGGGRSRKPGAPGGSSVEVVQTNADLSQRLTRMPDVHFRFSPARGVPVIHVDEAHRYQAIRGFGAAMTDTSAWLLNQLPAATRATVMEKLFGAAGIHLSFIRLPIGASDFTARGVPYSYDDLPPGRSDPGLIRFSIAHDRAYILPALREMLTINPEVQILASLWSAPGWMKANGSLDNLRERGTVLPSAYGALARYFVRFIEAYASAGVPVQAVTPQNEPGLPTGFPGMSFPEPTEARFIAHYLAPALRVQGCRPRSTALTSTGSSPPTRMLSPRIPQCCRTSPGLPGIAIAATPTR
jgi:glucosylceramidase